MVWDTGSLQTRLYARKQLGLSARIEIHVDHAEQLRFSFPEHQSRGTVIDVSEGGLGLLTQTMLPKQARLEIHIQLPSQSGNTTAPPKVFRGIVRRCSMIDVKPTYQIGLQYLDPDMEEVRELVKIAEAPPAADTPENETQPPQATEAPAASAATDDEGPIPFASGGGA